MEGLNIFVVAVVDFAVALTVIDARLQRFGKLHLRFDGSLFVEVAIFVVGVGQVKLQLIGAFGPIATWRGTPAICRSSEKFRSRTFLNTAYRRVSSFCGLSFNSEAGRVCSSLEKLGSSAVGAVVCSVACGWLWAEGSVGFFCFGFSSIGRFVFF